MSNYQISKSSLLSLKAEILRKGDELNKVKLQNDIKLAQHVKKNTRLDIKNKGLEQRTLNDSNVEEENLLKKSREALERKSKLYDKLSNIDNLDENEVDELNKRYLVSFQNKVKEPSRKDCSDSGEEDRINEDDYGPANDEDDEWIEYTDCLGRTRTCLKKDLEHIKQNDQDLRNRVEGRGCVDEAVQICENKRAEDEEDNIRETDDYGDESELLSSDMRRELLRRQWEKEEDELRNKSNVHYQDILFNEARTHGVAYYQFSKDEDVRKQQQDALKNLRKETEDKQKKANELRQLRDKQLKARVRAAKNRKRARMGLPPEEESEEDEKKAEQSSTPPEQTPKPAPQQPSKEELAKEIARKTHIRPWDVGKEGVREHYVYEQEEWVEKMRKERPTEFAPPKEYNNTVSEEDKRSLFFTTKKRRRRNSSSSSGDEEATRNNRNETRHINPYKASLFTRTPISNEVDDDESSSSDNESDALLNDYNKMSSSQNPPTDVRQGVQIAPPSTYHDELSRTKVKSNHRANLEESIDAGLKFLRMQTEKKTPRQQPTDVFLD